uniref:Uncharacterized protein n=1 Tax=Anguilla anguilla TaxID=7936 RepID=A0A0E9R3Y9_ANGAN
MLIFMRLSSHLHFIHCLSTRFFLVSVLQKHHLKVYFFL